MQDGDQSRCTWAALSSYPSTTTASLAPPAAGSDIDLLTLMIRLCGHEKAPIQPDYIQSITPLAQDLITKEQAAEVSLPRSWGSVRGLGPA